MPKDLRGYYKVRSHHDLFRDLKDILANVHVTDVRGNPTEQAGDHGDVIKAIENMYADFDRYRYRQKTLGSDASVQPDESPPEKLHAARCVKIKPLILCRFYASVDEKEIRR